MKRLAGQAGIIIGYALHHIGLFFLTAFMLLLLAFGLLAFRLSLGPLQIPYLASELATAGSGQGVNIHISKAALAWAGYRQGGGEPLYLQLNGATVSNAIGVELAKIPDARLVFLPSALLGTKAPIIVNSTDVRFNGSDVDVSLVAAIRLGFGFKLSRADLIVNLEAGRLGAAGVSMPISGGAFSVHVTPRDVSLENGILNLAASGASAPIVKFSGSGHRDQTWHGTLIMTADQVQAADLPAYWPLALAAITRHWVTTNITAGTAHDAKFNFALRAPLNLSTMILSNVTGNFMGDNLTLGWLPKAAPITGLYGTLAFVDKDNVLITADRAQLGNIKLSSGTMKITGVSHKDQIGIVTVSLGGQVADAVAVLNAQPLALLQHAPPQLLQATGDVTGKVVATLPLANKLKLAQVQLAIDAALTNVAVPTPLSNLALSAGTFALHATGTGLDFSGSAQLAGETAFISAQADFQSPQVLKSFDLKTSIGPAVLDQYGLDAETPVSDAVSGSVPLELQVKAGPKGTEAATVTADLTPAKLGLPVFGWSKKAGAPGKLNIAAALNAQGAFVSLDRFDAVAQGLFISGRVQNGVMNISQARIGRTAASGTITPGKSGSPWRIDFSGAVLDIKAILNPPKGKAQPAQPDTSPPSGLAWQAVLKFQTLHLAGDPAPFLQNFTFTGSGKGGSVLNADAQAMEPDTQLVNLTIRPVPPDGAHRNFHLDAGDAGTLLRVLGAYNNLEQGALTMNGVYGSGSAFAGTLNLIKFRILNAPAIGKVLQTITIYGAAEAASGPGLQFNTLIAPFSIARQTLTLTGARAYSTSLGFTVSGTIGLADGKADLDTTVIPAYALNSLPGKIPIIGKLFSAEKGGGLISVRVKITGLLSDPKVSVNPFSALTPGALRGVFNAGEKAQKN